MLSPSLTQSPASATPVSGQASWIGHRTGFSPISPPGEKLGAQGEAGPSAKPLPKWEGSQVSDASILSVEKVRPRQGGHGRARGDHKPAHSQRSEYWCFGSGQVLSTV